MKSGGAIHRSFFVFCGSSGVGILYELEDWWKIVMVYYTKWSVGGVYYTTLVE